MKPILEVKNINKQYGNYTALKEVSLVVEITKVFGRFGLNE